jgi:hypothetical protein
MVAVLATAAMLSEALAIVPINKKAENDRSTDSDGDRLVTDSLSSEINGVCVMALLNAIT